MHARARARARVCVCVCVRARARARVCMCTPVAKWIYFLTQPTEPLANHSRGLKQHNIGDIAWGGERGGNLYFSGMNVW